MSDRSVGEYAQLVAAVFQRVDQSSDSQQVLEAIEELRDIFDQVKGQSKYASLVPVISEAIIELNSAVVFNEIADLRDNAKKLKPLIATIQGIADETESTAKVLRLEKLRSFLATAKEAASALKEAKEALGGDDLTAAGPSLQKAWEEVSSLLEQLSSDMQELEQ